MDQVEGASLFPDYNRGCSHFSNICFVRARIEAIEKVSSGSNGSNLEDPKKFQKVIAHKISTASIGVRSSDNGNHLQVQTTVQKRESFHSQNCEI